MSAQPPRKRVPGRWIFVPALGISLIFGSVTLRDFNQGWESGSKRVLVGYADKLARGLPTICNGLTRHVTKTPIIVGQRWTDEQCEREERTAMTTLQRQLVKCFKRAPAQSFFDMASDHAWNNGVANTCNSAAVRAWNEGRYELACTRLAYSDAGRPVWASTRTGRTLPNGKPEMIFVQGVHNRRVAEMKVCRQLSSYKPGPVE